VKATVEDGKVVDIAPDRESGLPNELCPVKKGRLSIPEVLAHPDRLKYPLKRMGERGEGKWERISWDEALDTIATKLMAYKAQYGPESVAWCLGEPKGLEFAFAQRFATAFGTPNVITPGWCCGVPSGMASALTYGWNVVPDEEQPSKMVVLWAVNNNHTASGMRREAFERALANGAKLIVVDPRKTDVASIADIWVKPRPNSDGALAMGLLKVIVENELYDKDFVRDWCDGFDKLVEELKTFTLREVEEATWVPEKVIREFATMYATTKPAALIAGIAPGRTAYGEQYHRATETLSAMSCIVGTTRACPEYFQGTCPVCRPSS
jgi:anaerobic selenocysteine-containing dehydrogenase